jgi:hypothetical protein
MLEDMVRALWNRMAAESAVAAPACSGTVPQAPLSVGSRLYCHP